MRMKKIIVLTLALAGLILCTNTACANTNHDFSRSTYSEKTVKKAKNAYKKMEKAGKEGFFYGKKWFNQKTTRLMIPAKGIKVKANDEEIDAFFFIDPLWYKTKIKLVDEKGNTIDGSPEIATKKVERYEFIRILGFNKPSKTYVGDGKRTYTADSFLPNDLYYVLTNVVFDDGEHAIWPIPVSYKDYKFLRENPENNNIGVNRLRE